MPFNINITPLAFQKLGLLQDPEAEKRKALEEQRALRERVGADIAASVAPVAEPSGAFAGMGVGPMSRPVQSPEFGGNFLNAGGTPGQLIDIIRNTDPTQRDVHKKLMEQAVRNILLNRQTIDEQLPELQAGLRKTFGMEEPQKFDPSTVRSRTDLERAAALGLISPEDQAKLEQVYPAPGVDPTQAATAELLKDPEVAKQVARINLGLEPKAGKDTSGKEKEAAFERKQDRLVKRLKGQIDLARGNTDYQTTDKDGNSVFNDKGLAEIARLQAELLQAYMGDHPELQDSDNQPSGQDGELTPDEQVELQLRRQKAKVRGAP